MLFSSGAVSLAEVSCAVRHKGTESAMALLRRRVDARVPLGETTVIPAITYEWLPRGEDSRRGRPLVAR